MRKESRKKPISKNKNGLTVQIDYADQPINFELDDPEADFEDPVYTDYPVKDITVSDQDGRQISLAPFWPEATRLIGPVEDIEGPGQKFNCYDNYEDIVFFTDLAQKGGLLDLFHEIGHAVRNKPGMSPAESERQAWGFAMRALKKIKEKNDLDLEPDMTPAEIRTHIKRSLLTHEIGERYMEAFVKKIQKTGESEPRTASSFWREADPEFIDQLIDEMYADAGFEFTEKEVPAETMKKTFRPNNK